MTCCAAALGRLWDCWSKLTVANATVLFLLIWPAPAPLNGLATARTWGRAATCWSIRCARACTAGSRSVPAVACRTIWSELPEAAGKSFCSRLSAVPDWVPGRGYQPQDQHDRAMARRPSCHDSHVGPAFHVCTTGAV